MSRSPSCTSLLPWIALAAAASGQDIGVQWHRFWYNTSAAFDTTRGRLLIYEASPSSMGPDRFAQWDGTHYSPIESPTMPPTMLPTRWPIGPNPLCYDEGRGRLVMLHGPTHDTWEWDGFDWARRATAAASPPARYQAAMVYHQASRAVVLFGGMAAATDGLFGDTWTWDGSSWTLRATTGPSPRHSAAMAYDSLRQRTVLFGGQPMTAGALDDTWEWDGNVWQPRLMAGPTGANGGTMTFDVSRGECLLYVLGPPGGSSGELWRFDGAAWALAPGPAPVEGAALTYFPPTRQSLLAVDGTWRWTGTSWTRLPANGPIQGYALAYDAARRIVVCLQPDLWATPAETLEWDGAGWCERPSALHPPGYSWQAVYDHAAAETVLFGRDTAGTWGWNANGWRLRASAAASPPPRSGFGVAYDPARARTVLFGGYDGTSEFGDTWEWDGVAGTWSPRSSGVAPSARWGAAMTYHHGLGLTVLTGGLAGSGYYQNDTWVWNGSRWQSLAAPGGLPGHFGRQAYWHPVRQRLVLCAVGTNDRQDWEFDGAAWAPSGPTVPDNPYSVAYDAAHDLLLRIGFSGVRVQSPTLAAVDVIGAPCNALPPRLTTAGRPTPGNGGLRIDAAMPEGSGAPMLFVGGFAPANVPLPDGCTLLVQPAAIELRFCNQDGFASIPVRVPADPALRSLQLWWQGLALAANGGSGLRASSALRVAIGD